MSSVLGYKGIVKSGYLSTRRGKSALAFTFYGKKNITEEAKLKDYPTLIWLNGGPGSSSQLGNFLELGPIWLKGDSPVDPEVFFFKENNDSWVVDFNVLFVDNPVGTGLSYADVTDPNAFVTNMSTLAVDFYNALGEMYNNTQGCFNKLGITDKMPLFITGESYAGKYVPAIAAQIVFMRDHSNFLSGLKGIAIGDAFTFPAGTLRAMGSFGTHMSLLDNRERTKVEQLLINASLQELNRDLKGVHDSFNKVLSLVSAAGGGVNVYNIQLFEDYDTDIIRRFL